MADASIDVLMRVVGQTAALSAESMTIVPAGSDKLAEDFLPGKFCELKEFSFSAGIASAMSKKQKEEAKIKAMMKQAGKKEGVKEGPARSPDMLEKLAMEKLVLSQEKRRAKHQKDEVIDMQPVEFTRTMDCMSTLLFQSLVNCETLKTISIIKRKASGVGLSGLAYLRLDFTGVLMTQLDWKDAEHVITESGTFIYRAVTIQYRPQLADGTLGTIFKQDWKMTSPTA